MTNIDMNPATAAAAATAIDTQTGILEAASDAAAPHDKGAKKNKGEKKNKAQRRAAKALAYFALIFTGLLVLAEPWLLIPAAALVLAISLWD
ncbi:hypothetical protein GCM10011579_095140 [Streptomyces albiflavescens]|uniref:Uncharacterized protein n=1 Tax=Streptomyces albiflavescens TaxID=1623582 RepID=A0A917YHU5_9ACTN|nr:hypothetical protein [Streptomyces albiflavescens]GGN95014.1 hypothetical protein GCM10011579_095140 [Streptomyces albiflavescens]